MKLHVFEVAIGPGSMPGRFRVEVVRSQAGEASAETSLEVENILAGREQLQQTLLASATTAHQVVSRAGQKVRDTGRALFAALLGEEEIAGRYRASTALAEGDEEELRIVLRIDAPELAGLPWEAMYDLVPGAYVCRQHQLVRQIPVSAATRSSPVDGPLRILAVVSAPSDLAPLDAERERAHLERSLTGLAKRRLVSVTWAPSATWADLHEILLAGPWHALHFVGHGEFDPVRDEGLLALVGEDGRADLTEASRIADLLRQARPMPRLIVLNSCSGATVSVKDLYSGTAAALTRGGATAVAAMQYAISDQGSVAFARGFYNALATGRPVDEAVSAGRIAILGTSRDTLEWITPVLYLRGSGTRLFDFPRSEVSPSFSKMPTRSVTAHTPTQLAHTLTGYNESVHVGAFSGNGAFLATVGGDNTARIWDTESGNLVHALADPPNSVHWLACSPGGNLLATGNKDGTAQIWDTATGKVIHKLTGHRGQISRIAFSPDGLLIATSSYDNSARIWNAATGNSRYILNGHKDQVSQVLFNPAGTQLVTASADRSARIWDVATGRTMHTLAGQGNGRFRLAFSPDGTLLAIGSVRGTCGVWNIATGEFSYSLPNGPAAVDFSPDGTKLAACSGKVVHIWHAAIGKVAFTLIGHTDFVYDLAFSPDGDQLATVGGDGTVRIWDLATGKLLSALTGHGRRVYWVTFSLDGKLLATGSEDGTVRLWS